VVEDISRGTPLRLLRADHSFIGGLWVESKEPAFGFVHLLEAVHLARPQGTKLLQIGLGIGSLPMVLARHSVRSDVIEIDPEVIRLAQKHFGYTSTGELYAEDARTTIRRLRGPYDFIVHDAFTGGTVPEHLLSLEVLEQLERLLEPGGVVALNFVGTESGPLAASAHAVHRTLRAAFDHVRVFRDGPRESTSPSLSNLVFFASNQPIQFQPASSFDSETCRNVLTHFQEWEVFKTADPNAELITDARNPLARLTLPVSEAFWKDMNRLYPPEFWVH
jgi:predicted O-methyltransferase YrrM